MQNLYWLLLLLPIPIWFLMKATYRDQSQKRYLSAVKIIDDELTRFTLSDRAELVKETTEPFLLYELMLDDQRFLRLEVFPPDSLPFAFLGSLLGSDITFKYYFRTREAEIFFLVQLEDVILETSSKLEEEWLLRDAPVAPPRKTPSS